MRPFHKNTNSRKKKKLPNKIIIMPVVLYLGMATDICPPLLLVPHCTMFYAIDLATGFNSKDGTWESQKEEIRTILTDGHAENSFDHFLFKKYVNEEEHAMRLKSAATITSDHDVDNKWTLVFEYDGLERMLIYYHHRNFFDQWPSEIDCVTHLMTMGTPTFDPDESKAFNDKVANHMFGRMAIPVQYYTLYYGQKWATKNMFKITSTRTICRGTVTSLEEFTKLAQ